MTISPHTLTRWLALALALAAALLFTEAAAQATTEIPLTAMERTISPIHHTDALPYGGDS